VERLKSKVKPLLTQAKVDFAFRVRRFEGSWEGFGWFKVREVQGSGIKHSLSQEARNTERAGAPASSASNVKEKNMVEIRGVGAGCRVQGAGCRVQGAGCRVWGVECRV